MGAPAHGARHLDLRSRPPAGNGLTSFAVLTPEKVIRLDAAAIAEQLADRIDALARQLLPNGRRGPGRTYRCGSISGEGGQSLCVWLDGPRRGHWRDYAEDSGGDALDLVAAAVCGRALGRALSWARDWLGLGLVDPGTVVRVDGTARGEGAAASLGVGCPGANRCSRGWGWKIRGQSPAGGRNGARRRCYRCGAWPGSY